jgi:serine phosphatase RsbU (regulator of sigma subunit)
MVEAHGPGDEEFGVGRLIKEFLDIRELPADEIARALIKRVGDWAGGGEPEDDRTVVVLKRHTEPFPPEPQRPSGEIKPS